MTDLDRDFLWALFSEIDDEVAAPVGDHILIVGGAALIFAGLPRGTADVDAVSRLSSEPMRRAIRVVGERHNLPYDWFNDRTSHFFDSDELLACEHRTVFEGRNIKIFRPDLPCLLAMKLRSGRIKDRGDALWLMDQTGIKAKGALLHLISWAFPDEPVTAYTEWFVDDLAKRIKEG